MARLLRKLTNASLWIKDDGSSRPASALLDMRVNKENRYSFWLVGDDDPQADLNRIASALTVQSKHCRDSDYVLIDQDRAIAMGLELFIVNGNTINEEANSLHRDIQVPTVDAMAALVNELELQPSLRRREVAKLIADFIEAEGIDPKDLPEDIEERLISSGFLKRADHDEERCLIARAELAAALETWHTAVLEYRNQMNQGPTVPHDPSFTELKKLQEAVFDKASKARQVWKGHSHQTSTHHRMQRFTSQ
jgi:hypothetical protein